MHYYIDVCGVCVCLCLLHPPDYRDLKTEAFISLFILVSGQPSALL